MITHDITQYIQFFSNKNESQYQMWQTTLEHIKQLTTKLNKLHSNYAAYSKIVAYSTGVSNISSDTYFSDFRTLHIDVIKEIETYDLQHLDRDERWNFINHFISYERQLKITITNINHYLSITNEDLRKAWLSLITDSTVDFAAIDPKNYNQAILIFVVRSEYFKIIRREYEHNRKTKASAQ